MAPHPLIRRNRGYAFEASVVAALNKDGWEARRLGGSSVGMPDVVAVNNKLGILYSMECKSTKSVDAYIPQDQLLRCLTVRNMFSRYENGFVVLGFKFAANKPVNEFVVSKRTGKKYRKKVLARSLKYYFFLVSYPDYFEEVEWIKCDDTGSLDIKWMLPLNTEYVSRKYKYYDTMALNLEALKYATVQRSLV